MIVDIATDNTFKDIKKSIDDTKSAIVGAITDSYDEDTTLTEIKDLRTIDGVTYSSAGEGIRSKFSEIDESLVNKIDKEDLVNGITFKGSDTTVNIKAKTDMVIGDKWYSTDEDVYYMYSSSGWINCGSGENLALIENEIGELKETIDNIVNGEELLFNISDFVVGGTNDDGEYQPSNIVKYRITTPNIQTSKTDIVIHVDDGYRYSLRIRDGSANTWSSSGWLTTSILIKKYSEYKIVIDKTNGSTTPVTVNELFPHIRYVVMKSNHEEPYDYIVPSYVRGLIGNFTDFRMDSPTKTEDVYAWYNELLNTFPNRITRKQLGISTTPTGTYAVKDPKTYPIYCYTIKCNSSATKKIILGGGIHGAGQSGDPIEGVVACAYYIRDLMFNQNRNKFMQYMFDNCVINVVPLWNPWGIQNDSRGNGNGVDVNRNFDINFIANADVYDGLSTGTSPFSENESIIARDFLESNKDALFFSEIHSRMNESIPNDTRWLTISCNDKIDTILGKSISKMQSIYGGASQRNMYTAETAISSSHCYAQFVKGIPSYEPEFFRSNNLDLKSLDGLSVMWQCVNWYAVQIQLLVEYYCMSD